MELSSLLSNGPDSNPHTQVYEDNTSEIHKYPSPPTMSNSTSRNGNEEQLRTPPTPFAENNQNPNHHYSTNMSPYTVAAAPKSVAFELLFPESPQYRARLPMRVQIFPHDTTDSIVTTVKNFYGLYAGPAGAKGVSFEDEQGNTLIARYENLRNNMVVYVRVIDEARGASDLYSHGSFDSGSQQTYYNGIPHHMAPPHPNQALNYGHPQGRPTSRSSRKRSVSPISGRGRRSASVSTNGLPGKKQRSRSGYKSRGSSTHGGSFAENLHSDGLNGYSSGDGAASGSVSSRTKSEHLGNTEISLDNIVEGGRRKRAKFESSELPLFAPPQMPAAASNSSVSPQRRLDPRQPIGFTHPSQHPFANAQMLHSPQSYGNNYGQPEMYATPAVQGSRRTRGDATHPQPRSSISGTTPSSAILPTPDPTVGSCMSEEDKDVALQLMRLGDLSNISHGRTSASTLDDTFSGKADAASSTGATSDGESDSDVELPLMRPEKRESSPILPPGSVRNFRKHLDDILPSQDTTEPSGDEADSEDGPDPNFKPETQDDFLNDLEHMVQPKLSKPKTSSHNNKSRSQSSIMKTAKVTKPHKTQRPSQSSKSKTKTMSVSSGSKAPISPTSLPPQSRKASVASTLNFQHQLGDDEEDLSSKPRCQRCRKSKKGCDRQRPCQRCKDAGLSADQCVSEDEGNGRKGRYGRHMGVPVKKDDLPVQTAIYPPGMTIGDIGGPDKSKKRKR